MHQFGTYVEARDYIRARAWVRGFPVDAVVLGWSGSMVYLTWHGEKGRHLGWVPAADVERVRLGAPPADAATTPAVPDLDRAEWR